MWTKSKSLSTAIAAVFMTAAAASMATPANAAVVYCKTAGVPQGCVVRPTPVIAPVRIAAVGYYGHYGYYRPPVGVRHVGYTRVGPYGVHHAGYTRIWR